MIVSVHSFTPKKAAAPPKIGICGSQSAHQRPVMRISSVLVLWWWATIAVFPANWRTIAFATVRSSAAIPAAVRRFLWEVAPSGCWLKPVIANALAEMGTPTVQFTRPLVPPGEKAMDERTREQLEAAVFRRLVAHLRDRTDVQNIDLMTMAGFCRNCLGDWYRDAATELGIAMEKDAARELVYGMPQSEWKKRYQKEASSAQQAAFERAQKTHS
jgi:hypothetical protein